MKKQFVIKIIILIIITVLISSCSAETHIKIDKISNLEEAHQCEIKGYGMCYGISINGDISQGQGRNRHIIGAINGNISIRNQDPIPSKIIGGIIAKVVGYRITITDVETGQIYTEKNLPTYIYLTNITATGFINDYHEPWGATRALYFFNGIANYVIS